MNEYMMAKVTVNKFLEGGGKFIGSEDDCIMFRGLDQLERLIELKKNHSLAKYNIRLDIIVDSIESI